MERKEIDYIVVLRTEERDPLISVLNRIANSLERMAGDT